MGHFLAVETLKICKVSTNSSCFCNLTIFIHAMDNWFSFSFNWRNSKLDHNKITYIENHVFDSLSKLEFL